MELATPSLSKFEVWIQAIRPKTLWASVAPVVLAFALAGRATTESPLTAIAILLSALLLQIISNLANDLYDHKKGADTERRVGPQRVTQSGLLSIKQIELGVLFTVVLAGALGCYLVWQGGLPILLIGTAAIACAILYTAGPYPLGYLGLGDVFVFVFFGPVAIGGSIYLLTGGVSSSQLVLSSCPAALATAILAVNNYRDYESDRAANKRTLAVLFGREFVRREYQTLLLSALVIPTTLAALRIVPHTVLIVWLSLPLVLRAIHSLHSTQTPESLNQLLASTAQLLLVVCILLSIGVIL